jgi:hypothetical protein
MGIGWERQGYTPLRATLWQRDDHVYVSDREVTALAVTRSVVPVVVNLGLQEDCVSLLEAQLARVLCIKVVERVSRGPEQW